MCVVVVCQMKTLLVCVHAYLRISPYPIESQQKENGLNSVLSLLDTAIKMRFS